MKEEVNLKKEDIKKYMLLIIVMIFSICTGYVVYSAEIGIYSNCNIQITNDVKSRFSIEEILNANETVVEKIEIQETEVPFKTQIIGDSRNGKGNVVIQGNNGTEKITYKVQYVNQVETERKEISKAMTIKPTSQIVVYGISPSIASRYSNVRDISEEITDAPVSGYSRVLRMRYTAYCLCKKCCGKDESNPAYGLTASGYRIKPGQNEKVVAIDTNVIKLGSNVYVQGLNGKADYGYAYAGDTGGAIKGNRIDLYIDSHQEALKIGTGYVNVYIWD